MMSGISEKAKLVSHEKQELNGLKQKQAAVIRNLNKFQLLLDACKVDNPLSKTSAEATITQYNVTQI